MKKSDTRMILNVSISDEDLEKHIEIAIEKYIESILDAEANEKVDAAIKKYVDKKIDAVLNEKRYNNLSMVEGKYLSDLIADAARPKVQKVISSSITKAVTEALADKFKD